mgnify:CR=1 FL=1
MSVRDGASLVELIVALTIFTVGLLGLAAVAAVAQRSFAAASAVERGSDVVAQITDSLLHVDAPVDGRHQAGDVVVHWQIAQDSTATTLFITAAAPYTRVYSYRTVHSARAR